MAEKPFQIPGLGQARSDDRLPADNFEPDLLIAAACAADAAAQDALLALIDRNGMYSPTRD